MTNRTFFGILVFVLCVPIWQGIINSIFEPKPVSADQTSIGTSVWRMANSLERIEQLLREKNCK